MKNNYNQRIFGIFQDLLTFSGNIPGLGDAPHQVSKHLPEAVDLVDKVASTIGEGTHGPYFEVSKNRYAHYFAAGMGYLPSNSLILDIGNAPGHAAIGFNLMGHRVKGLNLNSEWRRTYPNEGWFREFDVVEHNIEHARMPFMNNTFDAVLFTEILEHITITDPKVIFDDIHRVLKSGGVLIFSTPNVCNISNIFALMNGQNIFWPPEVFYGSTDRHNREYTSIEVHQVMVSAGFDPIASWGLNDYSNWRAGGAEFATQFIEAFGDGNPLCRNTIAGVYRKA